MHLLFLGQWLLFIQATASTLLSNIDNRDVEMTRYTVYPSDPTNATKVAEIGALLRTTYGDATVEQTPDENGPITWSLKSERDDLQAEIKKLEGVRRVAQEDKNEVWSTTKRSGLAPRADVQKYMIAAREGFDTQETEDFLKSKIEPGTSFTRFKRNDDIVRGWGMLALNSDAKQVVRDYKGVNGTLILDGGRRSRVLPYTDRLPTSRDPYAASGQRKGLVARAGDWVKQENADDSLKTISQYPNKKFDELKDFVYNKNAGKDTYIYVIEEGVSFNVKNSDGQQEFKTDNNKVLQTQKSIKLGLEEDEDEDPGSHATRASSKALGRKFGVAKEATLIPVKLDLDTGSSDFEAAMELILTHLRAQTADRRSRSVVFMPMVYSSFLTYATAKADSLVQKEVKGPIDELFQLGVPFVSVSGNFAKVPNEPLRPDIDTVPSVIQDDDTPLIVVGAVDSDGERPDFCQAGTQLTVYAPGVDVKGQTRDDGVSDDDSGTSYAAPLVAGLVATYMSYSTKPWDDSKTGVERVKAIRAYLLKDESSWVRDPTSGLRVVWNGATEDDHKSVGANGLSNPPPVPESKGKAISIILENWQDNNGGSANSWLVFATNQGVSSLCADISKAVKVFSAGGDNMMVKNKPLPGGADWALPGLDRDCVYKNDNTGNPGALWCQDLLNPGDTTVQIPCKLEEHDWKQCRMDDDVGIQQYASVACEW